MKISLEGCHSLVCGASKGIGAAIAIELSKAGSRVTVVARNEEQLLNTLSKMEVGRHQIFVADFTNQKDVEMLCDYISINRPNILVNNTGGPSPCLISDARIKDFEKALNMHLFTSHRLTMACLSGMKKNEFGRIINIISTSVRIPIDDLGVSNTTRGAMASWAKTLSNEIAKYGITVNNILPGLTKTERLNNLVEKMALKNGLDVGQMTEKLISSIPARRYADPSEIGKLTVFLSSTQASYINGESIRIDGGRTGSI